jgi:uncharacterized membrane protein
MKATLENVFWGALLVLSVALWVFTVYLMFWE